MENAVGERGKRQSVKGFVNHVKKHRTVLSSQGTDGRDRSPQVRKALRDSNLSQVVRRGSFEKQFLKATSFTLLLMKQRDPGREQIQDGLQVSTRGIS